MEQRNWAGEYMIDRMPGKRNWIRAIIPVVLALLVFVGAGVVGGGLLAADSQRHITAELACQEPPHCEETGEVIGSPTPFYKDYYAEKEEIWVAVNPKIIQQIKAIGQINKCITARIYIVCHKTTGQWTDDSPLIDITGEKCGEQYLPEPEEITFHPGDSDMIFIQAWKKPVVCNEGYDVVVDFSPFEKYTPGLDIIDGLKGKGFFVPSNWVYLESVTFNHDPDDDIMDGINLRMNAIEEVHIPEWKKGEQSYPAAYIKNRAITIKAVFSSAQCVDKVTIIAVTKKGCLGNIVKQTFSFFKGHTVERTFDVNGCTPNGITTFNQEWKWYIETENKLMKRSSYNIQTSNNKIFILLARPQSPWKAKGQTEPWCDVLEETCKWTGNAESPIEAAEKITKHLYMSIGGYYETESTYTANSAWGFEFIDFFRNIKIGQAVGDVNCFSMGKALVTLANTVGCGLLYRESFLPNCKINCIKEIGKGWNCEQKLGIHGFGSIGKKFFDACFKFGSNCIHKKKYHDGIFAVNLKWDEYKKYLVRDCEPTYPKIHSFNIDGISKEKIGFCLIERIDWAKIKGYFDKCKKDYRPIIKGELPEIKAFYFKEKKINLGEKAKIILKIKNPGNKEFEYFWKVSGGGIEKNCKGDLFYYGSEPGEHVIRLTLGDNEEMIGTKYIKITVLNNI